MRTSVVRLVIIFGVLLSAGVFLSDSKTILPEPHQSKEVDQEQRKKLVESLETLGYFSNAGTLQSEAGVLHYVPEKTAQGLNLYCSNHAPEAVLMDMEGRTLHSWSFKDKSIWKGITPLGSADNREGRFRRARLFADGSLLVNFEYTGLIKIDRDSRLIWKHQGGEHHDLEVGSDGDIFVLTHKVSPVRGRKGGDPIVDEYISVLSADGSIIKEEHSILEYIENSKYKYLIDRDRNYFDPTHANSLQLIRNTPPVWQKTGRLALISARHLDAVLVLDLDNRTVIWAYDGRSSGEIDAQHEARFLDNDRILVFDNLSQVSFSRVLEIDPLTNRIEWIYAGSPQNRFYSEFSGTGQRLSNGNTLITVSGEGRAIEITPGGKIVWEFVSPHRYSDNKELVAELLQVQRIEKQGGIYNWLP